MAPKRPPLSPTAERTLDRYQRDLRRADAAVIQARADVANAHKRAVLALLADGLTVAHVADLLGLSRQWVARLRGETGK